MKLGVVGHCLEVEVDASRLHADCLDHLEDLALDHPGNQKLVIVTRSAGQPIELATSADIDHKPDRSVWERRLTLGWHVDAYNQQLRAALAALFDEEADHADA
jgi:hypothetical protein